MLTPQRPICKTPRPNLRRRLLRARDSFRHKPASFKRACGARQVRGASASKRSCSSRRRFCGDGRAAESDCQNRRVVAVLPATIRSEFLTLGEWLQQVGSFMASILVARVGLPSWFIVTGGKEEINSNDPLPAYASSFYAKQFARMHKPVRTIPQNCCPQFDTSSLLCRTVDRTPF
jgi:hypothetical protein